MKFYQKTWFIFLMLLFIAPVGIFLLWKYKRFNKISRILLSIVFGLIFLGMALPDSEVAPSSAPPQSITTETQAESDKEGTTPTEETVETNESETPLKVHFIDVGQADSILIQSPTGSSVLIDGGNNDDGQAVVDYLKAQGVKELAAIVATHPHEDHIGGLDTVIENIKTNQVYMPNATATTKTFEDFVRAVKNSGTKRIQVKSGVALNVDGIAGTFLAPVNTNYEELNDYSAVLKITYGSTSFLFTGDAESISEKEILDSGQNLKATVLKVGHHGSESSTTSAFLKAVSPKYAVITVGAGNNYGHPHEGILSRLVSAGVQIYRTDQSGTIIAKSDGNAVTFDKAASPAPKPTPTPSTNGVKIADIDLKAEIVTLKNTGSSPVDLTGWKIVSEKGSQTFEFPQGTTIPAGGTLQILSGKDAQAGSNQITWGSANIWNNDGDPGALYDASGKLISRYP